MLVGDRMISFTQLVRKNYYWSSVACRESGDSRGNLLIVCPLIDSSIEQWPVCQLLLLFIRSMLRHIMTPYSRLQTNVLARFVDTTCILFYYMHSPYSFL